jgi:hypothetical protein
MSLYTIGFYYEHEGRTVREIVNPDWRMSYVQADQLAAEYTSRHADSGRRYTPSTSTTSLHGRPLRETSTLVEQDGAPPRPGHQSP